MFLPVLKANPYKDAKGRFTSKERAVSVQSIADDLPKQMEWLQARAQEMGKQTIDELMADSPEAFMALAAQWRTHHTYKAARILKANPFHDAAGKFTTKEKAVYQGALISSQAFVMDGALATDPGFLNTPSGKAAMSRLADHYVKLSKHYESMGETPPSLHYLLSTDPTMSADHIKLVAEKIKGVVASKKAWVSINKNKAIKFAKEELPDLYQAAEELGSKKAMAKLDQKLAHHQKLFLASGGSQADWDNMTADAVLKSQNITPEQINTPPSKEPPKPVSADSTPTPPSPPQTASTDSYGVPMNLTFNAATASMETAPKLNHDLGVAYYLKRTAFGKDHPTTQAAYAEWQKSKDWLKAADPSFDSSATSLKAKQDAEALEAVQSQKALNALKQKQAELDTFTGKAATLLEASTSPGLKASTKASIAKALEDLQAEAKASGVTDDEWQTINYQANVNANAALVKKQATAKETYAGAVYQYAKLKAAGVTGTDLDSAEAVLASSYASLKNFEMDAAWAAEITKTKQEAIKKAKDDHALAVKHANLLKDSSSILHHYDTGTFKYFKNWDDGGPEYEKHVKANVDKLTDTERNAVKDYTGSGYKGANKKVAAGSSGGASTANTAALSSAFAKMTLGADMRLRRNAPQLWFWKSFGITEDKFTSMTEAEAQAAVIGKTYVERAFSSTSRSPDFGSTYSSTADHSGALKLNIRAHKDIRGLDVRSISGHDSEREVVLDKNLVYVIRGIRRMQPAGAKGGGFHYEVDVDAIGHEA